MERKQIRGRKGKEINKERKQIREKKGRRKQIWIRKRINPFSVLPLEVIDLLSSFLTIQEKVSLSSCCKLLYNPLSENLHQLFHKCGKEIEDAWNERIYKVRNLAMKRYEETKECNSIAETTFSILCSITNREHHLKLCYVRNPRDCDLLAWYLDGEKNGYTLL